jgi:hypothetical protein
LTKEEREEGRKGKRKISTEPAGRNLQEPNGLKYLSPAATPGADEREYATERK